MDSCFHRNDRQGGGVEAEPRGVRGFPVSEYGNQGKSMHGRPPFVFWARADRQAAMAPCVGWRAGGLRGY